MVSIVRRQRAREAQYKQTLIHNRRMSFKWRTMPQDELRIQLFRIITLVHDAARDERRKQRNARERRT